MLEVKSTRMNPSFTILLTTTLLFATPALRGQIVSDNFNDGNDAGWTRANLLESFGGTATYSFPNGNSYRMVPDPSPNPGALGPARTGSLRVAEVYTNSFYVSVEMVGWADIEQDIGILALVKELTIGELDGYAFSYDVDAKLMFLSRLDNENPSSLGSFDANLDPAQGCRLVLQGFNGEMSGEVYSLASPEILIGSIVVNDLTYTTGPCGLFVAHAGDGTGIADATYDNYRSTPNADFDHDGLPDKWEIDNFGHLVWFGVEDIDGDGQTNLEEYIGGSDPDDPASLSGITDVAVAGGQVTLTFPILAGRSYALEISTDLETWTVQPGAVFADNGATGSLTLPTGGQSPLFGRVVATLD